MTPAAPFGDLLKYYRQRAGLSQEKLAERAGCSTAAVGALEQGARRSPYRHTFDRLVAALDLSQEEAESFRRSSERIRLRTANAGRAPRLAQNNLPVTLTSFIDRPEVDDIARLLGEHRMVTITGPGGIGKTRTVIEAVRRMLEGHAVEVIFVDLSSLNDGSRLADLVASSAGLRETGGGYDAASLARSLADRPMLLFLDNCEHLLEDVGSVVQALLIACSRVAVVSTSRERLGLSSEVAMRLPSLRLPDRPVRNVEQARSYGALDLFLSRAQAADAFLDLSTDTIRIAIDICRRLDGLPLAIELVSAHVPTLGMVVLRDRIFETFSLPRDRDRPRRQKTVEAAVAWSYDLLDKTEQELLTRLSVFVGGFTLEAAEIVCGKGSELVAMTLVRLVRKSLVNLQSSAAGSRYFLLETVRFFSARMLSEGGEFDSVARSHACWLADLPDGSRGPSPVDQRYSETENARAAILRYAFGDEEDALLAARIAGRFRNVYSNQLRSGDVLAAARQIVGAVDKKRHPQVVLRVYSLLIFSHESKSKAYRVSEFETALGIAATLGAEEIVALCQEIAVLYAKQGWHELAEEALDRAGAAIRSGDVVAPRTVANLRLSKAWIRSIQGRLDEARIEIRYVMESVTGDDDFENVRADAQFTLAEIEFATGNDALAAHFCSRALAGEALTWPFRAVAEANLSCYLAVAGDIAGAERHARRAIAAASMYSSTEIGIPVQHLATVAALQHKPISAARLCGFADEWYRRSDRDRQVTEQRGYDVLTRSLAEQLSPGEIAAYATSGAALTWSDVLDEVQEAFPE